MNWNSHYNLEGQHALLSPSNYHWIRYDKEKLTSYFTNYNAKEEGTKLHSIAATLITNRIKLAKKKTAFNLFVNDSIGFMMQSEQPLLYSRNAFGTTDSISFRDSTLRIFDLKTGNTKASFEQLDLYAAYCCLEYMIDPLQIKIIERIYQYDGYEEYSPDGEYIKRLMDITVEADSIIEELKQGLVQII